MNNSTPNEHAIEEAPIAGEVQMSWTIKALPHNTSIMDIGMIALTLVGLAALSNGIYEIFYLDLPMQQRSTFLSAHFGIICLCMTLYFWTLVIRQKNIYHYVITDIEIDVEYKTHLPQLAVTIFKWLSGTFIVSVFIFIAYNPSAAWLLAGPAGISIVSAIHFLNWKNPTKNLRFTWDRPNLVLTDRKRNLVAVQRRYNPEMRIEDNYLYIPIHLPRASIDEFLVIAKKFAPPSTDFEEGRDKN
ncbi:hypothetical protein ACIOYV_01125 [Pseudomonas sp. NPDC087342]|uniref:hypothetical protein n=1 Tax=Pseudomonas sp. NPDC087342 TaxID=3364437 RepID=UPI0037F99544